MENFITENDYPIRWPWVLKATLGDAIVIFISVIGLNFLDSENYSYEATKVGFWMLILVLSGIFRLVLMILRKITFHYSINEQFLKLNQGIASRQERHIPYGVIQNIIVKQDLFDRIFGLASLVVENASLGAGAPALHREGGFLGLRLATHGSYQRTELAGFWGNKISIPGLLKDDAEKLKGIILEKMKENPVDDNQSGL